MLLRRLRDLIAAPVKIMAFGIAAADRARSRYSWARIAMETAAAYERCLAEGGRQIRAATLAPARHGAAAASQERAA